MISYQSLFSLLLHYGFIYFSSSALNLSFQCYIVPSIVIVPFIMYCFIFFCLYSHIHHVLSFSFIILLCPKNSSYIVLLTFIIHCPPHSHIHPPNSYDNKNKCFRYCNFKDNIVCPKSTFRNHLNSHIIRWIHMTQHMNQGNCGTNNYLSKYQSIPNCMIIHHTRNDTYDEWVKYSQRLNSTDIIIATDSSHKNDLTGIGIIIKDNDKLFRYSQPLGKVTNHYMNNDTLHLSPDSLQLAHFHTITCPYVASIQTIVRHHLVRTVPAARVNLGTVPD